MNFKLGFIIHRMTDEKKSELISDLPHSCNTGRSSYLGQVFLGDYIVSEQWQ